MAYRNGTYVAFHAQGTNIPTDSDIRYYNLLKAWTAKGDDDFAMVNSHDKTYAVKDSSSKETLKSRLRERLRNSKNMLLLIGDTTRFDNDWVPFEIEFAIDHCGIPIIVAYLDYGNAIYNPSALADLWPNALKKRIENRTASCIHIPFKKEVIKSAIEQFSHVNKPLGGGLGCYSATAYQGFGL